MAVRLLQGIYLLTAVLPAFRVFVGGIGARAEVVPGGLVPPLVCVVADAVVTALVFGPAARLDADVVAARRLPAVGREAAGRELAETDHRAGMGARYNRREIMKMRKLGLLTRPRRGMTNASWDKSKEQKIISETQTLKKAPGAPRSRLFTVGHGSHRGMRLRENGGG